HRGIHRKTWRSIPGTRLEARRADKLKARLVTVYATEMGGDADGAGEIAAERETAKAGGQRRGAASGGSSRGSRSVPRVVAGPVDRVVALPVTEHDWHVRLADDDSARRLQALDRNRGSRAVRVLERRQAPGVGRPLP